MNRPIALLTDFGTQDWFVASIKGVILSVNPHAVIVDITHGIPAGDIAAAAFNLLACHASFPKGTIFVAVIDPGVGSFRQAIAAKAGGYFFVGPDNGVLSLALDKYKKPEIRLLENSRLFGTSISSTFHGRDIFAPVAGHLSKGVAFDTLGPRSNAIVRISLPQPQKAGLSIIGSVIYIDRFGNAITTIPSSLISRRTGRLQIKNRFIPLCSCYEDVDKGTPLAIAGSCGLVEISVNQGNAARKLKLKVGDTIRMST